ncbi:hypothetical protein Tco_0958802 [Tanacetum coccineum]
MNKNRLIWADELHKFSDGTLDDVWSALNDIAKGIRMEYLPLRKWSNLDKKRAQVMVQVLNKQLYQRRLMRTSIEIIVEGNERYVQGKPHNDAPVMRTASAAAKPCQGDSSEFYLITGSIYIE